LSVLSATTHNTLIVSAIPQSLSLNGELLTAVTAAAPRWVAGALVVLLGARAALLVTDISGKPGEGAPTATSPVQRPTTVDVPSILRSNLFGRVAVAANGADAPVTSIAMVLVGVIADADPARGYAILGASAAAVALHLVGDTLPGGARLHSVYPDRVLLDRGGTVEALMLPRQSTSLMPPPPMPVTANALDRVQKLVRENPGIVGEILRPQAVLADGKQRGYRVYPGPNQKAFEKLGLRPGDLVIAINGTSLDDPSRGGEIFGTLGSVAEARVTVVRGGSQQDLNLNLAAVATEAEKLNQERSITPSVTGEGITPAAAR
jgi:general secretion pathway protein C